jgi:formylglycine-generating enzyme required for sulfatase activity
MHGNVLEWCSDWYSSVYYGKGPRENPWGASEGSYRVIRGGCWDNDGRLCRSAIRNRYSPDSRNYDLGFRAALVPAGK